MATTLHVHVLTENTPVSGLACEHGLCALLHCERDGAVTRILLDFGQTDAFARNADALGLNLSAVDLAVLSHAHYDHADGMPAFFARNARAPLYLSEACGERCWSTKAGTTEPHYIGIAPGLLTQHADRMVHVSARRATTIAPGVHLVPHTSPGLAEMGRHAGMLLKTEEGWEPDDFAHEQTLVVELDPAPDTMPRLAVFNSCSHAGVEVIAREVREAFPGACIAVYVGGLHLVHSSNKDVQRTAQALRAAGIEHVYTGHCTGARACELLARALPERVHPLAPGIVFQLR